MTNYTFDQMLVIVKVGDSPKLLLYDFSSGQRECLNQISWKSIQQLSRCFTLDPKLGVWAGDHIQRGSSSWDKELDKLL